MQQLYLHPTWEKAISPPDRALIEQLYEATYDQVDDLMMSPVIRVAFNYKKQLLVMVLVHNFTHHAARFQNRSVFIRCGDYMEEQTFTIPELVVPPFSSMPWTFIFEPDPVHETLALSELFVDIE